MTYAHGVVYGIDSESNFFTSTPGSTQRTIIGQTGTAMITAMAYNYANGKIYAVGYTQQSRWDLYEINMQTGAATVIGQPEHCGSRSPVDIRNHHRGQGIRHHRNLRPSVRGKP